MRRLRAEGFLRSGRRAAALVTHGGLVLALLGSARAEPQCDFTSSTGVRIRASGPVLLPDSGDHPEIGSGGEFPGQEVFQSWPVVDRSRAVRVVSGTLTEVKHNCCGAFDDRDWNVFLTPSAAYSDVLINEKGVRNRNGSLETELRSADPSIGSVDLRQRFTVGQQVDVCGWWTSDYGHDPLLGDFVVAQAIGGKTELHPIQFVHQATGPKSFRLFAGQDVSINQDLGAFSSRFQTAAYDLRLALEVPMPVTATEHRLSLGQVAAGAPARLTEVLQLDYVLEQVRIGSVVAQNTAALFRPWLTKMTAYWTAGGLQHDVHFRPAYEGGRSHGVYPMLLADISRDARADLTSRVTLEKKRSPAGVGYLSIGVRSELRAAAGDPYAVSSWLYPSYGLADAPSERNAANVGSVAAQMVYAPMAGHTQTLWGLSVRASTQPWDWDPGARAASDGGVVPTRTRSFYSDQQLFSLEPTHLKLARSWQTREVALRELPAVIERRIELPPGSQAAVAALPACEPGQVRLVVGVTVQPAVTLVHPSVTYQLSYLVKLPSSDGYQTLQLGASATLPGYALSVASSGVLSARYTQLRGRREPLVVLAIATTDVSESPYAETVVPAGFAERAFWRDGVVITKPDGTVLCLRPADVQLGVLGARGQSALPARTPAVARRLAATLLQRGAGEHELYRLARELPPAGVAALSGVAALLEGREVSAAELGAVIDAAALGAAVRRALPPAKRRAWPLRPLELPAKRPVLGPR